MLLLFSNKASYEIIMMWINFKPGIRYANSSYAIAGIGTDINLNASCFIAYAALVGQRQQLRGCGGNTRRGKGRLSF